jgi:uncharacterized glyoxalase superfamily protein PhnB
VAEGALIDRLDQTVDALLTRGDATAALRDPELAPLARVAADLRHYPSPDFKARLRAHLERRTTMAAATISTRIQEGFTTVTPYVRVREAGLVDFLARVFDAEETYSAPGSVGEMHRQVRIGNSMIMIGEGGTEGTTPVRPMALHVYVENVDATFERALAAGGVSLGVPEDRPYGERAGFIRDAFGNHWYIATQPGKSHIPEGLRSVTPFVRAHGAERQIEFLKQTFGAIEERRHDVGGHVRYARLRIGNGAIELGEAEGAAEAMTGAFYLFVGDTDLLYQSALAAGATSLWPPTDQPYGERMAGVQDAIGNLWFISSRP